MKPPNRFLFWSHIHSDIQASCRDKGIVHALKAKWNSHQEKKKSEEEETNVFLYKIIFYEKGVQLMVCSP